MHAYGKNSSRTASEKNMHTQHSELKGTYNVVKCTKLVIIIGL